MEKKSNPNPQLTKKIVDYWKGNSLSYYKKEFHKDGGN